MDEIIKYQIGILESLSIKEYIKAERIKTERITEEHIK